MQRAKNEMMLNAPIERLIGKLAIPTIISMLVTGLYNIADTYFVGQLDNTSATGAVGVIFPLMSVIQAVGFFFGHGSGNYVSRALGAGRTEDAEKMTVTGFVLSLIAGTVIMTVGLVFSPQLTTLLGSTDTIRPYAEEYMRYILISAPFMCGSFVLNNQLRFQGNAVFGMVGILCGAVLNIALDPLLIFVLDLGVAGAAIATAVSQTVSFFVLLVMSGLSDGIKMRLKNMTMSPRFLLEIVRGGIPSLCRQGLASVGGIFLNNVAGNYSDAMVAAYAIVQRIMMFAFSAVIGFGQGFQPVCGFNYGAGKWQRVKKAFWFCVRFSGIFLVVFSAVAFVFAPQAVGIFQDNDAEVLRWGTVCMRYQLVTFPLMSWIVMSNMMTQTIGKAGKASFLAMSRQGLMLVPMLLILPKLFGETGLALCQPVSDLLTFVCAVPLQISELKELDQKTREDESDARTLGTDVTAQDNSL